MRKTMMDTPRRVGISMSIRRKIKTSIGFAFLNAKGEEMNPFPLLLLDMAT
jgi:hypothetical protein